MTHASHDALTRPAWARTGRLRNVLPGLMLCLVASAASYGVSLLLPDVSPLIVAIALGVLFAGTARVPAAAAAGVDFSSKKLLRASIVLLGLQLKLADVVGLGLPMLVVVACIVAGGMLSTVAIGRLLRVPSGLTLLIACGFSICGAAAVAAAAGVTSPDDEAEDGTITAVALVIVFGTLMILLVPTAAGLLGLGPEAAGMWAGGSIHEIAQVVAVGGIIGGSALGAAVVVKLSRVLLLAPVIALLGLRQRRIARSSTGPGRPSPQAKPPPAVPPFIIGFVAMVLLRSFVPLPEFVPALGGLVQTGLLATAMFALVCGVKIRSFAAIGFRPFALALSSTVIVAAIAYAGVAIVA